METETSKVVHMWKRVLYSILSILTALSSYSTLPVALSYREPGLLNSLCFVCMQLERMRNENTLFLDESSDEPDCEGLRKEQGHLEEVIMEFICDVCSIIWFFGSSTL